MKGEQVDSNNRWSRRQFLVRGGKLAAGTTIALSSAGFLEARAASAFAAPKPSRLADSALETVTFQLGWLKLAQFGGHFVALQNGYFKDQGIDAQFLAGGSGINGLTLLESGQVMMADANGSDILTAVSKGVPVQSFGTIYQSTPNALMSLGKEPLTTLKSLQGKTVGLPNGEQQLLTAMLTQAGVNPSSVKIVTVGTDPSVLTSGQVQGYIGYGTEQGLDLQKSGADVKIVYFNELGDPDYGNAYFAKTSTLNGKSDLVARWMKADLKGWKSFVKNPQAAAKLTWNLYHTQTQAVLANEKASAKASVPLINSGRCGQARPAVGRRRCLSRRSTSCTRRPGSSPARSTSTPCTPKSSSSRPVTLPSAVSIGAGRSAVDGSWHLGAVVGVPEGEGGPAELVVRRRDHHRAAARRPRRPRAGPVWRRRRALAGARAPSGQRPRSRAGPGQCGGRHRRRTLGGVDHLAAGRAIDPGATGRRRLSGHARPPVSARRSSASTPRAPTPPLRCSLRWTPLATPGVRAAVVYPIADAMGDLHGRERETQGWTTAETERHLDIVEHLARDIDDPTIELQLGPVGPQWVAESTLAAVGAGARRNRRRVHMHLLESPIQRRWADRIYPEGIVELLRRCDLLGEHVCVAHGTHLRPAEMQALADAGTVLSINVSSNLRLASGIPPVAEVQRSGMSYGAGLDGMALGDDADYWTELRLLRGVAQAQAGVTVDAGSLLETVTERRQHGTGRLPTPAGRRRPRRRLCPARPPGLPPPSRGPRLAAGRYCPGRRSTRSSP